MRAAVVGLGVMGKRHLAALSSIQGVQLVAVCDTAPQALGSAPVAPDVGRFENLSRLLRVGRPELLIVATTAPSHCEIVLGGLDAGVKRILCEKPMACSLEEARRMIAAAAECDARLAVNHCRRMSSAYAWLARQIRSGALGRLRGIQFSAPGIGLGCLGTHFIDLMHFLSGERVRHVWGWLSEQKHANPRGAEFYDPAGLVVAEDTSRARYIHHQLEQQPSGLLTGIIDLTEARVLIDEGSSRLTLTRRGVAGAGATAEEISVPADASLRIDIGALTAAMIEELVGERPLTCSGEDGRRSLEVLVATYLSHEAGHTAVPLPLENPSALTRYLPIP